MDKIKADKYILKKFGASLGTGLFLITFLISRKSPQNIWPTLTLSLTVYILALIKPLVLKPLQTFFTKVGLVVTWIITRVLLFIIFYCVFTPMGLIIRLFGVDFLDRKIDKDKKTYWKKKENDVLGKLGFEKQF